MPFFIKVSETVTKIQVRAFMAVAFTIAFIVGFFMGLIAEPTFSPVAVGAIMWYLGMRQGQDSNKPL